jgi:hypothetical protein
MFNNIMKKRISKLLELISLHTLQHGENSAMSFFSLCLFISRNILTCVFSDEIWTTKQSLNHICQTRLKFWVIRSTGHQVNPWVIRSFILLKSHSFVLFLKKNLEVDTAMFVQANQEVTTNSEVNPEVKTEETRLKYGIPIFFSSTKQII